MWPFEDEDHFRRQLREMQDMADAKQAELDGLDGADGNPTLEKYRADLKAELAEIEIRMAQTREQAEERGRDVDSYEHDQGLFND